MIDYIEMTDEALQALAASGNSAAEEALAERYSRLVRICARPFFLAGGDSEDLTQEGMLGLLAAIRSFNSEMETSFKTYAEICIKRRIISAVKTASRLKNVPLNEGISLDDVLSAETQTNTALISDAFRRIPEEQVLARESEIEFYTSLLHELSRFESKILELFLRGLSYREIAAKTFKTEKSVDNAVQRIRRKLAESAVPRR